MKFWQSLAMLDMDELPTLARHAEELGFEGITLSEHLITFSQQYDDYNYSDNKLIRWYPETHWPDPWVAIGALSQVTRSLLFMTSVAVLPMRDPFSLAKSISTAVRLSGGRVIVGGGIGWQKTEFELVGQDFHSRGRRADEMLEVMQRLWTGEPVSHEGMFYRFPPLQMSPGTRGPVPIYIGGFSDAALGRAARHDGWIGAQHSVDELQHMVPTLLQLRRKAGLATEGFGIATGLEDYSEASVSRCAELGVTRIYREAFCDKNGMASRMSLDDKLRSMDEFANRFLSGGS